MMQAPIRLLLDLVDEAFDRKAWHGTTLLGSIRGVSVDAAAWRPAPRRHNIWELTVHAGYWKYAVRRLLAGEKRGSFALKGSNWFTRPAAGGRRDQQAWAADVRLLIAEHRLLRETIAALPARALEQRLKGKRYTAAFTIRGIAAHDLYHAGQIQLIKRLHE
jgi:DinB family protein